MYHLANYTFGDAIEVGDQDVKLDDGEKEDPKRNSETEVPETENPGIQLTPGTPKIESLNSSLFNISFEYAQPGDDIDGGGA